MDLPNYKKLVDNQLTDKLISFLQTCKSPAIIEINGTINSLAAGVLLQKALGEKAIALIIDFDTPKTTTLIDLCKSFNLNAYVLKRGAAYQTELKAYHLHQKDLNNFYKRFINYHLSVQADIMGAQIVDNIDKSGRLTNQRPDCFYGSFMPFYSLYKTEVYDLAKFLNIKEISTDHEYWEKIDPILFLLTEKQLTPEQISQEFKIDLAWLKKLKKHIEKQTLESPISQFII